MKRKFWLFFTLFLIIFCLNLIFYTKKLDKIQKIQIKLSKDNENIKIYHNILFKPKCNCLNYSIGLKLEKNKYKISKIYNNSTGQILLYEIAKDDLESSYLTCDKFNSLKRGPFQKIISYALYGKKQKFYKNIEKIIESASTYFPDWSIRIYYDSSIHEQTICKFECHENVKKIKKVDFCNVEDLNISLNGMYWRLMPLG